MSAEVKTVKTEIELPADILYSQGVYENRAEYFVKKNFLLELYREGKISLGRMAALLGMNRVEMLGVMKSLFNFFWSVEKHDTNPANTGTIRLVESVKSVSKSLIRRRLTPITQINGVNDF